MINKYIKTSSGMLLNEYEWAGGYSITPKEQKARLKEVAKEEAVVVESFEKDWTPSSARRKF